MVGDPLGLAFDSLFIGRNQSTFTAAGVGPLIRRGIAALPAPPHFINHGTECTNDRHSGKSRTPGAYRIPDQVRHVAVCIMNCHSNKRPSAQRALYNDILELTVTTFDSLWCPAGLLLMFYAANHIIQKDPSFFVTRFCLLGTMDQVCQYP